MADPITVALTGVLSACVIAGALLAYPVARLLLHLYRRSVARSMRMGSGSAKEASATGIAAAPPRVALQVSEPERRESPADVSVSNATELAYLFKAPWRGAAVYAAAGVVFAATMTGGGLIATRDAAIPMTKIVLPFWMNFWPAVLPVELV